MSHSTRHLVSLCGKPAAIQHGRMEDPQPSRSGAPLPGTTPTAAGFATRTAALSRARDQELLLQLLGPALGPRAGTAAEDGLDQAGGLRGLFRLGPEELRALPGWNQAGVGALLAARELVHRHLEATLVRGEALTSPADSLRYLQATLGDRRREVFTGVFLDTRHRVIACEELFKGSIDGACVYPRVVAEKALRLGAAAVIVAHNHPSGVSEPSLADQAITRRLRDALGLLEIRLLDHFVIGDGTPVSMAARGLL